MDIRLNVRYKLHSEHVSQYITFEYLRRHCFAIENRLGYQWFAQARRELRPSEIIKWLPVKAFPMCNLLCHSALSFMFRFPVGNLTVLLHCQDWWVEKDQYHHLRELTLEQYLMSHLEHFEFAFFLHTRQVESAKMSRARLRTPIKSQRRTWNETAALAQWHEREWEWKYNTYLHHVIGLDTNTGLSICRNMAIGVHNCYCIAYLALIKYMWRPIIGVERYKDIVSICIFSLIGGSDPRDATRYLSQKTPVVPWVEDAESIVLIEWCVEIIIVGKLVKSWK